ncbi:MAG TPA: hypothetical protein DCL43_06810 [Chitinophagaceae bacterium]|jgi:hypothetical protein|nr:hypothetical protein [Chitinophagaceae bacterium]HAN40282.1 hypothetical protein [Chitinophagaceae bacterium]
MLQRITILLAICLLVWGSYAVGVRIAEASTKNTLLTNLEAYPAMKQLKEAKAAVERGGAQKGEIFITITSSTTAVVGIEYTIINETSDVLFSEPYVFMYSIEFDKATKKIQKVGPYVIPVN